MLIKWALHYVFVINQYFYYYTNNMIYPNYVIKKPRIRLCTRDSKITFFVFEYRQLNLKHLLK